MSSPFKKIYIAADHAGFAYKQFILKELSSLPWEDLGTYDTASVDYPDYADKVAKAMKPFADKNPQDKSVIGVLICGSGQGVAIKANRYPFIRAALCMTEKAAEMSRLHNDANVLCMGERMISQDLALKILQAFLKTSFEGGRHEHRVNKLSQNC